MLAGWLLTGCGQHYRVEPGQIAVEIRLESSFVQRLFLAEMPDEPSGGGKWNMGSCDFGFIRKICKTSGW